MVRGHRGLLSLEGTRRGSEVPCWEPTVREVSRSAMSSDHVRNVASHPLEVNAHGGTLTHNLPDHHSGRSFFWSYVRVCAWKIATPTDARSNARTRAHGPGPRVFAAQSTHVAPIERSSVFMTTRTQSLSSRVSWSGCLTRPRANSITRPRSWRS